MGLCLLVVLTSEIISPRKTVFQFAVVLRVERAIRAIILLCGHSVECFIGTHTKSDYSILNSRLNYCEIALIRIVQNYLIKILPFDVITKQA